jgi:SNF2 family DNA or RNA helicase
VNFRYPPFKHQAAIFNRSKDSEYYGIFADCGLGKSKVVIDTAAYLYLEHKIEAMLVVTIRGVHKQWVEQEVPKHMSPDVATVHCFAWDSSKHETKKHAATVENLFTSAGLKILAINFDACITKDGFNLVQRFCKTFKTILIIDESHQAKNRTSLRAKALLKLSRLCPYRRALTGTPVGNSPEDLYSQLEILAPGLSGFQSFYTFRSFFCNLITESNYSTGRHYQIVVSHKNLDVLERHLKTFSSRVLKSEALDLPDQLYQIIPVSLSKNQARLYKELKDNLITELNGQEVTAPLAIVKLLRLQQILGNHFVPDATPENMNPEPIAIDQSCPRLEALLDVIEGANGKQVIWSRYVAEIKMITEALNKKYGAGSAASYFGATSTADRKQLLADFADPNSKLMYAVLQQQSGGTGIDALKIASYVHYFSNNFSYIDRYQTESRNHRIGTELPVTYFDYVAPNTIDTHILKALHAKRDLSATVVGDIRSLLQNCEEL